MDENHTPCAGVYHLFDQSNTRDLHYESSDQCYHPCLEQPCPDRYKKFDSDDATDKLFKPRSIQAAWILESIPNPTNKWIRDLASNHNSDNEEDEEDEEDDVLPALGAAPVVRKMKPAPSRGITASDQRPLRVTRSTAGAVAIKKTGTAAVAAVVPESPVKTSRQGPNKIPRLATTKTTSAAKALAAASNAQPRQLRHNTNAPPPTPSRLPTLVTSKRPTHGVHTNSLTDVGNLKRAPAAAASDAWVANNVAAVMVPATKSARPGLRNIRRRRSSFSSADVVA